ncbi:hypothetical protein SUT503_14440 [Streptococcus parasuis]|nr:hypothetical protein SUT503_14440 [Streptococcus parasuis]
MEKNIHEYQTIILFDTESTPCLIKWLATHATKEARLIFYYRNSIESLKVNRQAIMPDKVKIWV